MTQFISLVEKLKGLHSKNISGVDEVPPDKDKDKDKGKDKGKDKKHKPSILQSSVHDEMPEEARVLFKVDAPFLVRVPKRNKP